MILAIGAGWQGWSLYQEAQLRSLSTNALEGRVRQRPDDLSMRYHLGVAYAREGRQREAVDEFLAVLKMDAARADAWNDLGVVYLLQQRYREALLAFQSALRADPNYAPAHANLGRLHLSVRMRYRAVSDLERAARLAPSDLNILNDLGEAYQATLNFSAAEATYRRVLHASPRSVSGWLGLGRVCMAVARYREADSALTQALAMESENPDVLLALGQLRAQEADTPEKFAAARVLLERATKAEPGSAEAWYERGRLALRMKQPREAIQHCVHALRLEPRHTGAMQQLVRAFRADGRPDAAERMAQVLKATSLRHREQERLEEHLRTASNDWDSRARLAEIYLISGQPGLAALTIREIQDGAPNHPRLPALLGALQSARSAAAPATGSRSFSPATAPGSGRAGGSTPSPM